MLQRLIGLLLAACVVLLVAPARSATAQEGPEDQQAPDRPRIVVLSTEGVRKATFGLGETVVVLGEGFGTHLGGSVFLHRDDNRLVTEFSTDEEGRFRTDFRIRTNERFGGATVIAGTELAQASTRITIVRPSRATLTLPTRHRDVAILGTIATGLLFGGAALLLGAWPRRRRAQRSP